MLMLLMVSGDDKTIDTKGFLEESVLLPCACSQRSLEHEFLWQMEKPDKKPVYKYNGNTSNFDGKYEGRAKTFLSENIHNCSVLLINITAEDMGTYLCSFFEGETYRKIFVNLSIHALVSQKMGRPNMEHATDSYSRHRFVTSIPILLVVVLVLCLLLRNKDLTKCLQSIQETETDHFCC